MPKPSKIKIGQVYGKLTVVSEPFTDLTRNLRQVSVRCECGTVKNVMPHALQQGGTISCGCYRTSGALARTHGKFGTRIYRIWRGMLDRCTNTKSKDY